MGKHPFGDSPRKENTPNWGLSLIGGCTQLREVKDLCYASAAASGRLRYT